MNRVVFGVFALYLIGYALIRIMSAEVWDKDGHTYVIFPESPKVIYYVYRPLSYLDEAVTGVRAHIGPHHP